MKPLVRTLVCRVAAVEQSLEPLAPLAEDGVVEKAKVEVVGVVAEAVRVVELSPIKRTRVALEVARVLMVRSTLLATSNISAAALVTRVKGVSFAMI